MTLPRFASTVALLGWLSEPATSYACAGQLCSNDQFLPRSGKVPANITAIGWSPGFDRRDDAATFVAPVLPRFECRAADGGKREVRFVALPEDRPDHLELSEPLVAGEHCTISSGVTDCSVEPGLVSHLDGSAELDVVASSPHPEELGLLAITGAKVGRVDVAADASCSERIRVCKAEASVVFSPAALAWKDALLFETIVDGERFSTWRDASVPDELGGLYLGRDRGVLFAALGALPENAYTGDQLAIGEHIVEIRAHLPGSALILSTPAVSIGLECGAKAQIPLAENQLSGSSDGCAVAAALGSSQRHASLGLSVLGLLGALLIAARRRRTRRS